MRPRGLYTARTVATSSTARPSAAWISGEALRTASSRKRAHVKEQDPGNEYGNRQLEEHPVMAEQPPLQRRGLHETRKERRASERHERVPGGWFHDEVGAAHGGGVAAVQADQGELSKHGHRTEPAKACRDMRNEQRVCEGLNSWLQILSRANSMKEVGLP